MNDPNPYDPPQIPVDFHDGEQGERDRKLVCIGSFADHMTANMARSVLESEEIPACLGAQETSTMLAYMGTALGGIKLYVFEDQQDKAKALLEMHSAADLDDREAGDIDKQDSDDQDHHARDADEDSPEQQAYDGHVRRAWVAAVLSLVFCPVVLNVYSLYILFGEDLLWYPHTVRPNWRTTVTLVVNLLVLAGAAIFVFSGRL
jgi:hypothetical protein